MTDKCSHNGPMLLFDCVGEELGWWFIVTSSIITVLYFLIAIFRFLPSAKQADTFMSKVVWYSITFIFPFCAMAGYFTVLISAINADLAYKIKLAMIIFDIIVCIIFLIATRNKKLIAKSASDLRFELNPVIDDKLLTPSDKLHKIKELLKDIKNGNI